MIQLIRGNYIQALDYLHSAKKLYDFVFVLSFSDFKKDKSKFYSRFITESSILDIGYETKAIILRDIPNQKDFREILSNNLCDIPDWLSVYIFDSLNNVKKDSKTGKINKTWADWAKTIPNLEILDFGDDFDDKSSSDAISFIKQEFSKIGKQIDINTAKTFLNIVGGSRSLLYSEIKKFNLIPVSEIKESYVLQFAFPSSTEAVLYKFSNALNEINSYQALQIVSSYLNKDIHPLVLAEVALKKARWWVIGSSLLNQLQSPTEAIAGLKEHGQNRILNPNSFLCEDSKKKSSEKLPMPWLAGEMINFLNSSVLKMCRRDYQTMESYFKDKYLRVLDHYIQLRFNLSTEKSVFFLERMIQEVIITDDSIAIFCEGRGRIA